MHPGLEFLKATPEFQDKYAGTVTQRIFYELDWDDDGKIHFRDYKRSKLYRTFERLQQEDEINSIRDFFIYEHFYVIYCRFYELDLDHDEYINREDFGKYSRHALSNKAISRIWDQIPRKFTSNQPGLMNYEDFTYFLLCEEDKTNPRSIEYWFKVIDLDSNGVIGLYELDYFYSEQKQRLKFLNEDVVLFEDFLSQICDNFGKSDKIEFTLEELKSKPSNASTFFNFLTNLEKLLAYERKDPFSAAGEKNDYPDYTDWDKFAMYEYKRLSSEEDEDNNDEFLEGNDLLDGEGGDGGDAGGRTGADERAPGARERGPNLDNAYFVD
jgi:serine/threonine-protein phosphatase 2A regulatory subunit B''